ncbi:MFS transporter [Streptomyces sp. SID724]|uniref:MFS transporter n=1 Tax=Streptomyces sp. SID724 TaxID=2690324 RepID=UPI001360ED2F|nr:MFS transporter [Streptomyces sp. SID724]
MRNLLPFISSHPGGRSALTCRFRCGDACFKETPNTSDNEYAGDIIAGAVSRRSMMRAAAVVTVATAAGTAALTGPSAPQAEAVALAGHGHQPGHPHKPAPSGARGLRFSPVAPNKDDKVTIPDGYAQNVVIRWGEPILRGAPAFNPDKQTAKAQAGQFGYNNDFLSLLPLRGERGRQVMVANHEYTDEILVGFAMYAQSLVVPQLLQLPEATGYGLGQSMLAMGLWMAPAGLMMMAMSPVGAKLSAAKGPKVTLAVGSLLIAAGYGLSVPLIGADSPWGLLIVTLVCNSGVGFAYGAMPALIMSAVPQSETASANSFNALMRSIGTSFAAAVIGVVLARMTTDFGGFPLPSQNGFRAAMLIGCGVGLAAAVVAALIPVRPATAPLRPAASNAPAGVPEASESKA